MERYWKVLAVFFHHVAFDPTLGECVSIARSFPDADRNLPGVDFLHLCGQGAAKEHAMKIYRGLLNARTLEPRPQQPLTTAERKTLDTIVAQKRTEQRQYNFEQQLKSDAAEAAAKSAARKEEESSQMQRAGQVASEHGRDPLEALLTDDARTEPQEITFKDSDMKLIQSAIFDKFHGAQGKDADAPCFDDATKGNDISNPFARRRSIASEMARTSVCTASSSSNPFSRKRGSDAAAVSQSGQPTKIRSLGARAACGFIPETLRKEVRPIATPSQQPDHRTLVEPELHPRGGGAAKEAAQAVLIQRGIPLLAALPSDKDKSKLTGWFKSQHQSPVPVPETKVAKSALASWNPRPWEEPEEETTDNGVYENPLSMRKKNAAKFFSSKAW
jgi:hypothetical protein